MNGRYLLDTNVVIPLMAGDKSIAGQVQQAAAVFVASITVGELHFGARKSVRVHENIAQVEKYCLENVVLAADTETARMYGQLKNQLRKSGRPIPENDIWVAAIAIQYRLTLVTRDNHFVHVESLHTTQW